MNPLDKIRSGQTSDVEIGLRPLKRMAAEFDGWQCERCGETKPGKSEPKDDAKPTCSSKSRLHKWRKA